MQARLETIADHFEELEFAKNEYLLKPGKVSGYYYLAEGISGLLPTTLTATKLQPFFIRATG